MTRINTTFRAAQTEASNALLSAVHVLSVGEWEARR